MVQTVRFRSADCRFTEVAMLFKKQLIKYGAPGTGKTYTAIRDARAQFEAWKEKYGKNSKYTFEHNSELVQFHPSYRYEDFIEGLHPEQDPNGHTLLKLQNGKFKDFCIKAGKWETDVYNLDKELDWDTLTIAELEAASDIEFQHKEHWQYIFELEDKNLRVADVVPPFLFISDEINRTDLACVFGELIFCLEYRGAKKGQIRTKYSHFNDAETGMLKVNNYDYSFFIPQNVFIIGTMCISKSDNGNIDIESRRRFDWEEMTPDYAVLKKDLESHNPEWAKLADDLGLLNEAISSEPLLGDDCCFGHAYLMNLPYAADTPVDDVRQLVWESKLKPILQAYLHGRDDREELIQRFVAAFSPRIVNIR